MSNGPEFGKHLSDIGDLYDVICIQESWFTEGRSFSLGGYSMARCDRVGRAGGGCVTFIKLGIPFSVMGVGQDLEYVSVKIWLGNKEVVVVNFYNPGKVLQLDALLGIEGMGHRRVVLCGDFNAHSPLWGGVRLDRNGRVIEELLDRLGFVCLNDGSGTRFNSSTGISAGLDLTLVSNELARVCVWEVRGICLLLAVITSWSSAVS